MSKYVMSDLHACYDKFIKMLELIQFNENDELYILGDIFDRGDKPFEIVDYIVAHKNIYLIKGNHEQMFIECYEEKNMEVWYTISAFTSGKQIEKKNSVYEALVYSYLRKLPYIKVVDKFILVHGGLNFPKDYESLELEQFLNQEENNCLWNRSNIGNEKKYRDYTVICGHTPVQAIEKMTDVKILKRYGTIYIDCGCSFQRENGKLACLRLEDMEEFYVV